MEDQPEAKLQPQPKEQASKTKNPGTQERGPVVSTTEQISFSGPIPPPSVLAQYDKVVPGAAERIIRMAESQSEHRRHLEARVITTSTTNSRLGVVFGFVIGMTGLIVPTVTRIPGGPVISIVALASLVGVFIYGTQQRRSERAARRKEAGEE